MKQRHNLDSYYTSSKLTEVLVEKVLEVYAEKTDTILEPCAGTSSITDALWRNGFDEIFECDIDETLPRINVIKDASIYDPEWEKSVDWVVTNPPYTQPTCQQIIENSMRYARKGICMLLRLTYDEPCSNRAEFLKNNVMTHQLLFNPRPKFRADTKGTDSATTCWFVWMQPDFAAQHNLVSTKKIYVTGWDK